jgi:hypothetical protein
MDTEAGREDTAEEVVRGAESGAAELQRPVWEQVTSEHLSAAELRDLFERSSRDGCG